MTAVENSLRRLQTDHLDLYQIHRPDPHTDIEETLSALTDLVRSGKVRAIGSSDMPASEIVEAQWVAEKRGLERFRTDPFVSGYGGAFDAIGTTDDLRQLADRLLPAEWLSASATGDAATCAARIQDQLDAGADSVVLHGATPTELRPVVEAWAQVRPDSLDALPANPGWMS